MKDSNWKNILRPFKRPKEYLKISAIILIGFYLIRISSTITAKILTDAMPTINTEAQTEIITQQATSMATIIGLAGLLLFLIITAIWSLTTAMIYTRLMNKKITQKYYFKIAGLNIILGTILLTAIVFFGMIIQNSPETIYLLYTFMFIYCYYAIINYIEITKKPEIIESISKSIMTAADEWKKGAMIFLMMIIFGMIIWTVEAIIMKISRYPRDLVMMILIVMYIAWANMYMVKE